MGQREFGWLVLIAGVVGALFALSMNTAVETSYGSVNNIGLLNDKQNYLLFAGLMAVVGLGLVALSGPEGSAAPPPVGSLRECPECAEMIQARAKRCRFCNAVIEPLTAGNSNARSEVEVQAITADLTDADLDSLSAFYGIVQTGDGFAIGGKVYLTLREAVAAARAESPEFE